MAQAGIHSMVGMVIQKWAPARKWLMLGIVLGNLFPDADNFVVAIATLTGNSTEGYTEPSRIVCFSSPPSSSSFTRSPGRQNAPNGATWGWDWASEC